MSVISNRHVLEVFDSKKSKAANGQRLAIASTKITKEDKAAGLTEKSKPSMCASIPVVSADVLSDSVMQAFKPYVLQMVLDTQDKIVRQFAENECSTVGDDDISVDAVLAYLDDESKGARLTKEIIVEWFDGSLADSLALAFADKMGLSDTPTEDETKKLNQQIQVYREKLASLAGGKTVFAPDVAKKMIRALEFGAADDAMIVRFTARCKKMMEEPKPAADMMGL